MYEVPEPKKFAPEISPEQLKAMQPIDKLVQYVVPRLIDKVNYLSWKVDKLEHENREQIDILTAQLNCGSESFQQLQAVVRKIDGAQPVPSVPDDVLRAIQTLQQDVKTIQMSPANSGARLDEATVNDIYKILNEIHEWQHTVDTNMGACVDALTSKKRAPRRVKVDKAAAPKTYIAEGSYATYDPDKDDWVPFEFAGIKVTASVVDAVLGPEDWDYPEELVKFVTGLSDDERAALCARFPE